MMTTQRAWWLLLAPALLAACDLEGKQAVQPAVEETVFGEAVGTMDRARALEDTAMRHKQALDSALSADEGGVQ